jgi:enhancing lycopene biosynthesis protein 2
MKKRIGVVLSGCGFQDGAEIHEAVLTMLAIDRAGAEIVCMAPDRDQADVVDHLRGKPTRETRNVLVEAARIARGRILPVNEVRVADLDAVMLPGGFGAAKNLSTFAKEGAQCTVDPDVAKLLQDMHRSGKPIGALCIAPAVLAAVFGKSLHPQVTIGEDASTAQTLESMGARHRPAKVDEVVVDRENRIVTTPAYMLEARIGDIATGAEKAVEKVLELASSGSPAHA